MQLCINIRLVLDAALIKKALPINKRPSQAIKIKNKNGRDMWTISNFLLQDGVQKSILQALKMNLPEAGADDLAGLRKGLRRSLGVLRAEAVRVDNHSPDVVSVKFSSPRERGRRARQALLLRKAEDARMRAQGII